MGHADARGAAGAATRQVKRRCHSHEDFDTAFSGVAFYFVRQLHRELGVPVGIIDSSRGGTPIEPFIPREAFGAHPTLRRELDLGDQCDLDGFWKLPGGVRARDANWLPGRLFNSRLAPLARFTVRGAIWYQGESNSGVGEDPRDYQHKMRALITGWRHAFGNEQMPVYFIQLPGSGAGSVVSSVRGGQQ
jgi:sialate O-acetylesterase